MKTALQFLLIFIPVSAWCQSFTLIGDVYAEGDVTITTNAVSQPDAVTSANLVRWLRSDLGAYSDAGVTPAVEGAAVREWHDQSTNNYDLQQISAQYRPIYKDPALSSGMPALRFTAADSTYLASKTYEPLYAQPVTFYVVADRSAFATADEVVFDGTNTPNRMVFKSIVTTHLPDMFAGVDVPGTGNPLQLQASPMLYEVYFNGATSYAKTNHVSVISGGNPGANSLGGIRIGSRYSGTTPWNGYLWELIEFEGTLSTADKQLIATYIANRYGITSPY